MKLATLSTAEGPCLGALENGGAHFVLLARVNARLGLGDGAMLASMLDLIEAGAPGLDLARRLLAAGGEGDECVARADAALLAPLPRMPKLRCFSVYEKHILQAFEQVLKRKAGSIPLHLLKILGLFRLPKRFYEKPIYYKGNHTAVVGDGHAIRCPPTCRMLDYELELAVVIGKPGRDIARADAMDHVFGYAVFDDFSARDTLIGEMMARPSVGPVKGKDFDTGNVLGPWIVTADELPDPYGLKMSVAVNGEVRGRAVSGEMAHRIDAMIEYASRDESLVIGEVFACGAVGDGTGIEAWRFLSPGDVVTLTIDGIGTLTNRIS